MFLKLICLFLYRTQVINEYVDFNTYFLNKWLVYFLVSLGLIVILIRFLGKFGNKTKSNQD